MAETPETLKIRAIRVRSPHIGTDLVVDVQLDGEDFFRNVFAEEAVDGTLISHEVLPLGMLNGDRLDF